MGAIGKEFVNLPHDLFIGEMVHYNGVEGAFGGACPATGAGGGIYCGRDLAFTSREIAP